MKTLKSMLLPVLIFFLAGNLPAQVLQPETKSVKKNKPRINIHVQKKYDKNGNLIQYDSTYEWTFHNGNENVHIDMQQMMGDFKPFFRQNLPDSLLQIFGSPHFDLSDSSMMNDFFNSNNFFGQWQKELFDMNREMRTMDSLRMEFLKRYMQNIKHHGKRKNPLKAGIY
jgi:hypothetical protein